MDVNDFSCDVIFLYDDKKKALLFKPFQHILIGSERSLYLTKTTHPPPPTTLHNSVKIRYYEKYHDLPFPNKYLKMLGYK